MILIEQFGLLVGLVTVKDCLKYTLAHEASEGHNTSSSGSEELEQTLEELSSWFQEMYRGVWDRITGRRTIEVESGDEFEEFVMDSPSEEEGGESRREGRRGVET